MEKINFAFFGTSHVAVYVLDELEKAEYRPSLVVTMPDAPKGRGHKVAAPAVKEWALARNIEVLQPEKLDSEFTCKLQAKNYKLCIICDYGKILPKEVLSVPPRGFLNVHPSLLPRLRGASPMRSAILTDEKKTGVTIMLVDEKMDHGPIISQKTVPIPGWSTDDQGRVFDGLALRSLGEGGPPRITDMERILMSEGGKLLAKIMPLWVRGDIEARVQNHDIATYCEIFKKEDGQLALSDNAYTNLLKIRAFEGWPGTYMYFVRGDKTIRTKIVDAHLEANALVIDRVIPEGKKEMGYEEFLRSGARPSE